MLYPFLFFLLAKEQNWGTKTQFELGGSRKLRLLFPFPVACNLHRQLSTPWQSVPIGPFVAGFPFSPSHLQAELQNRDSLFDLEERLGRSSLSLSPRFFFLGLKREK
jgi:hypothetical protein